MGDDRVGTGGTRAAQPTGKRVARHASETVPTEPYVGRRVAREIAPEIAPEIAQQIAPRTAQQVVPPPARPVAAPVARPPAQTPAQPPAQPMAQPPAQPPAETLAEALAGPSVEPISAPTERTQQPEQPEQPGAPARPAGGRRIAARRPPVPGLLSAPVLMGVAVLGISVAGALQAVRPGLADGATGHHLAPASALSGSSAVGSASLLGGRGTVVSRSSDRLTLSGVAGASLQAAADAQAEQRGAKLSQLRGLAEQQAARIKLHQWVLPVQAGVYQLTARFGDYSPLWSHFHTGLDFAAPTGTPIMAVAGGTITDTGYSGAYGNRTVETLADGTELWYCHQNEFGTSVGATVSPGQVIGYIGSTGNVTGPHLHLEVHPGGGDPVDPFTALEVHGLHP
jgi:murein DD-endopeptidase MepM/ murein hydrolase activator NlpD